VILATHEAAANAVEHGRGTSPVAVRGNVFDSTVEIEVRDDGTWKAAQFHDDERGRGLMLISALVDEFELRSEGTGTAIVMVTRF